MKAHLPVRIESHPFSTGDLIGGDAALDFINTVTGRDQSPRDWLDSYTRLLEWAALVHLLPEKILRAGKKGTERAHTGCDGAGARKEAARNAVCTGHWDRFRECAAENHARLAAPALDRRHQCARAALRPWARGR